MISPNSKCLRKLQVGDKVLVKLLPCHPRYKIFEDPILFPIIGFNHLGVPLIGTMDIQLYLNHHFITTDLFYVRPEIRVWNYCMKLNTCDIEIEKIIRHARRPTSAHL